MPRKKLLDHHPTKGASSHLAIKYVYIMTGWSVLIVGSLAWTIRQAEGETLSASIATARTHISKEIAR